MTHNNKVYPVNPSDSAGPKVEKKTKPPYFIFALATLPMFACGLVMWAMINLHLEVDASVYFKAIMIGIVAGLVSYCINRFAIDWGAELTASGMPAAGIFSVFSMLAVAACIWFFSFGGITLPDVRILRMEDHGRDLARYVELQNTRASQAMRIVPVIKSASSDFSSHRKCEFEVGCISLNGGGAGTITRIIGEKAVRADNIASQLIEGTELLSATLVMVNDLQGQYQAILSDNEKSISKRRQMLVKIDAEIGQSIVRLNEAIPVSLIAAYAQELKTPVSIPDRPRATRAVNTLLNKHGVALTSVISTIENSVIERPIFPAKAGLSDTLDYIGNFAALAGVIWVAEGIFPLALFLYTLWFLIRQQSLGNNPTGPHTSPSAPAMSANANVVDLDDYKTSIATQTSAKKTNGGGHA